MQNRLFLLAEIVVSACGASHSRGSWRILQAPRTKAGCSNAQISRSQTHLLLLPRCGGNALRSSKVALKLVHKGREILLSRQQIVCATLVACWGLDIHPTARLEIWCVTGPEVLVGKLLRGLWRSGVWK